MADTKPAPVLCKVTIFEVAHRPWGELMTSAEVSDRVYVGSREWRRLLNSNSTDTNVGSHLPDPGPRF